MDAVECMKSRRSIRAYHQKPIARQVIESIVDCGRLAATAINIQPWLFIAVEDEQVRRDIAAATDYGKFIADAPVCIAVFCRNVKYFVEDGSAATQNILNAARALGLASCWVAGHQKPYAQKILALLGLPPEYQLISLVPVGYGAEEPKPEKRPLAEVLRWNHY